MCFLKQGHVEKRYKHITMTGKVNIVILVIQDCSIGNSTAVHTVVITCIKKICKYDFNAFSLLTQVRLLPEFVTGLNLPSRYN